MVKAMSYVQNVFENFVTVKVFLQMQIVPIMDILRAIRLI